MELITLTGDELSHALCTKLETPPAITARQARQDTRGFFGVTCHDYQSPLGWWVAEIGTDHGPESADYLPVRWRPARELPDEIGIAWRVVEEMKSRGWLFHVLATVDGWIVNGRRYTLVDGKLCGQSVNTIDFVQETGDTAPEAICRAALAALSAPAGSETSKEVEHG